MEVLERTNNVKGGGPGEVAVAGEYLVRDEGATNHSVKHAFKIQKVGDHVNFIHKVYIAFV